MKLTDKRFWIFEALSLLCGELTFCIAAGAWFALSHFRMDIPTSSCALLGFRGFLFMVNIQKRKQYYI